VSAAADRAASQLRASLVSQVQASKRTLRRGELALLGQRHWPRMHHTRLEPEDPGPDVLFLSVANSKFFRGLEGLLLSLLDQYPDLSAPFLVVHDGTIDSFLRRRLGDLYCNIEFVQPSPRWTDSLPNGSLNQRRIGVLGYLNTHALSLRGYRRVLVLDADLLVTGPLDPLWAETDDFLVVPDCGERPWAAVSSRTGKPVLNSGVISIPGQALSVESQDHMDDLVRRASEPSCEILDRFADQKVWNLFLADQSLRLMPLNYNCNVKYLVKYLGGCAEDLSVVHFAGPKPWLTWPWVAPDQAEQRAHAVADPVFWNRQYRLLLRRWRISLYRRLQPQPLPFQPGPAQLATTPLAFSVRELPRVVNRHLLMVDPLIFGDQWPATPSWPAGWQEAIAAAGPITLWAPLEWEPALRVLSLPSGASWRWLLIEAPFSPSLDQGEDLVAEEPPWDGGFEPWSDPPLAGVERAVRHCLAAAGADPVLSTLT
jgi:hypothetical protein